MFRKAGDDGYEPALPGIRRKTLCHGRSTLLTEFRLAEGHPLPAHAHPHEQTGYLVSGRLRLSVGRETFEALPGDSWCVPGGVEHGAEVLADSVAVEVFSPVRDDYLPAEGSEAPRPARGASSGRTPQGRAPEGAVVRPATAGDVPELTELMDAFYAEAGFTLDRVRAGAAFDALLEDPRNGRVWVVEAAGRAAGYVVVTLVFAMEFGGTMAVVDDFYVRPEARGEGLGKAALAAVRRACEEDGVRALRVEVGRDNAAAQAVYRGAGFEPVDHELMVAPLAPPAHVE